MQNKAHIFRSTLIIFKLFCTIETKNNEIIFYFFAFCLLWIAFELLLQMGDAYFEGERIIIIVVCLCDCVCLWIPISCLEYRKRWSRLGGWMDYTVVYLCDCVCCLDQCSSVAFSLWNSPSVSVQSPSTLYSSKTITICIRHMSLCHPSCKHKNIWWKIVFLCWPICLEQFASNTLPFWFYLLFSSCPQDAPVQVTVSKLSFFAPSDTCLCVCC